MVTTVTMYITHRTFPAYRHSFFVTQKAWITTRIQLYYLDLAVPNEVLFKKHFEKVFPKYNAETGQLSTRKDVWKKQRFHLDDISVGWEGRKDSNLFYLYAMSTYRKVDKIGITLLFEYLKRVPEDARLSLTSGEKAVRFLNLATLIGYQQWGEITVRPLPGASHRPLLVDRLLQHFYPSILKGIYEKKNEHPLLLKQFWDLFCITEDTRETLFVKLPDAEHLKFVLEVGNRTQFDFWGFRDGVSGFTKNIFQVFLEEKRFDLITLLLDYGFPLGEIFLCDKDCPCNKPLTNIFLEYASKEFLHNRFMVWFLVRSYDTCKNLLDAKGFIELYQKLSRSLPLPSQPPSMVREHLQKAFEQTPSSRTAVEEMTFIYEATDVHPSDCSVVAPQKLSQLSRCVLRKALSVNYQLPTAIHHNSRLPTLLKRYLDLEI